jgi:hypothetical protein
MCGTYKIGQYLHEHSIYNWTCQIPIVFDENQICKHQLIKLLNTAGKTIGIGQFKPQHCGRYGMFHVKK